MLKVLKFLFLGKTFEENNYKYYFSDVYEGEEGLYYFEINCKLPEPYQGYVYKRMTVDCNEIIERFYKYIGQRLTISYNLLVDGKEPQEVYLPNKKKKQIIDNLNQHKTKITFILPEKNNLILKLNYRFNKTPLDFDGENVGFNINTTISEWDYNSKILDITKLNSTDYRNLQTTIEDMLLETDLRAEIEGVIYNITEPDFQIGNYDEIYLNCNLIFKDRFDKKWAYGNYLREPELIDLLDSI